MTPKEEARQLVDKFNNITLNNGSINSPLLEVTRMSLRLRKQCALICVNMILNIEAYNLLNSTLEIEIKYWQEVKQEIKNYEPN